MNKYILVVIVQLSILPLISCSASPRERRDRILHLDGGDPLAVVFLRGKPTEDEDLLQSLDYDAGAGDVLSENLKIMKSAPRSTFQVTGWTDDVECGDEASCIALSARRASLVTQWYREHGALNLASPAGRGQYAALPRKPTEFDRRISRRAELWVN